MEHQRGEATCAAIPQRSFFKYARVPAFSIGMTAFVAGVTLLNVAHPLLHPFEGGTLDAALHHLNLLAMTWLDFSGGKGHAS